MSGEDFDKARAHLPNPEELRQVFEAAAACEADQEFLHKIQPGRYAVLDPQGNPIPASLYTWGRYLQSGNNRLAVSELKGYKISTIFLGLNHQYLPDAEPLWFETMIFSPEKMTKLFGHKKMMLGQELWCERCSTHAQAMAQHKRAEAWLTNYLNTK